MDLLNPSFYDQKQAIEKFDCGKNLFNLSSLKEFDHPVESKGFAIKFVCEGIERYTVNNKPFNITAGNYLLLNGRKETKVIVDSTKNVKGLCITVSNKVIAEVAAALTRPDTPFSDTELAKFFYTEDFLENQYHSQNTHLGKKLQEIGSFINQGVFSRNQINQELFFELAEKLVTDQVTVFKQLQSIPTVRPETKRDLCRRVLIGKEFIDSNYTVSLTIEQIARNAGMSEYHFFRLFKQMIGLSPYQYILSCRLKSAAQLLKAEYSVSDTAISMGFSDIFSFSKAFKKYFGVPPTQYSLLQSL